MINLSHLYYFYMTAKYGSVTKAADVLHLAQPSLSSQLKKLELSINQKLFKKKGRKLELTADGIVAYNYSIRIFDLVNEFQNYNLNKLHAAHLRVKIGVARDVERPFVADILSAILKRHKKEKASILMVTDDHPVLTESILNNELDVLVTNTPNYEQGFATLSSIRVPVFPVVSYEYLKKLNLNKNTSLNALLLHPDIFLILPTHKLKLRIETDFFLQKFKISDVGVFESDILAAVVRAVVEGVGVAFLPLAYVSKELKSERLMIVGKKTHPVWTHKIFLTSLEDKNHSSIVKDIKKAFDSLL